MWEIAPPNNDERVTKSYGLPGFSHFFATFGGFLSIVNMSKTIPSDPLTSYGAFRALIEENPAALSGLVEGFLTNIKRENTRLNAFVRLYDGEVRELLPDAISRLKRGEGRKLEGLVVGIKDLFCYADHPVQAASKILEGFTSQITATAVERLLEAGALVVGSQNCDEFAMGAANKYSAYGRVNNPFDVNRSAGGSSGGSAAAVATKMTHLSLGTDTGGSVRQPAAFCGVVGFKPTYGRIPRHGVIAYASSFDTVGLLAQRIEDVAAALGVVAGADERDTTSSTLPVPDYEKALGKPLERLRIGYLAETIEHPSLQGEIKVAMETFIRKLKEEGHGVEEAHLPLLGACLPVYYTLTTAEATANLARYDGVRFGYRAEGCTSFQEMVRKTRDEGFGEEVKRRLLLGSFILSSDYYDSHYVRAQKVRRLIKEQLDGLFERYDYLICPTTPTTAFSHAYGEGDAILDYLADLYTVPASVAGLPAVSLPYGKDDKGLPIGLQLIGRAFDEEGLLSFAHFVEGSCCPEV